MKELPREKVQLATKFGFYAFTSSGIVVKGTPEYARSCCEASLKRLQVDYIDLYYIHRIDTTVPIEDTVSLFHIILYQSYRDLVFLLFFLILSVEHLQMEELKKLVEEGKIKYIGLSEANADTIRRAHAVHPITALQMEYSLWTRDIEEEIIPLCRFVHHHPKKKLQ